MCWIIVLWILSMYVSFAILLVLLNSQECILGYNILPRNYCSFSQTCILSSVKMINCCLFIIKKNTEHKNCMIGQTEKINSTLSYNCIRQNARTCINPLTLVLSKGPIHNNINSSRKITKLHVHHWTVRTVLHPSMYPLVCQPIQVNVWAWASRVPVNRETNKNTMLYIDLPI